jgi:hypothetical protein
MARTYRNAFRATAVGGDRPGAALVCHPTGTGKTAVIAGLAHGAPEIGNVLILTTREAVRDQLARELSGNLFIEPQKFGLGDRIRLAKATYVVTESQLLNGPVARLYDATSKLLPESLRGFAQRQFAAVTGSGIDPVEEELKANRSIVLMTVQMLVGLAQDDRAYLTLKQHIDIVLFDEGHYEPAAKYSVAVRGLGKPTVLLSATPFRNDLKPFEIAAENIHIYKFADAVAAGYVREVVVRNRPPQRDEEDFCDDIIDFCTNEFGPDRATTWPRIIIHCDDMGSIARLGEAFIARGFDKVIGIHDRFTGTVPWQVRAVPPPRETDALIWIHQYKLMEGIDDHRFRLLAFFDPLKNVRSVVQQIGRVIRVTPDDASHTAIVLDHYRGRIGQYWSLYLDYDKSTSPDYLTKTMSRYYLERFASVHPEIDYIARKFRRRLDLEHVGAADDEVLFDRRVTLKRIDATATLSSFCGLLEEALTIDDQEFHKYEGFGPNVAVYLCAKVASPEFLNTLYFAEARHSARLLMLLPEHQLLAIAATSGSGIEGLGHLESVSPAKLERVLVPGAIGRVTAVTSQNTNLGNRVVRRRTISAPSIELIPPILDEHGHVMSMATGYNGTVPRIVDELEYQETIDEGLNIIAAAPAAGGAPVPVANDIIRRYIGITTGRISEHGPPLRLKAFRSWVESLADQMKSGRRHESVYGRFASLTASSVRNGTPKNLLLDLTDFEDRYKLANGDALRGTDLCVDRSGAPGGSTDKPSGQFLVTLNDVAYPVQLTFNAASQRYRLDSDALDVAFVGTVPGILPLGRALNETQAFNVIPEDLDVIYVHGRFYAPGLKFGDRFSDERFFVGHCLYPATTFQALSSEKGSTVVDVGDGYDPASLFGLIDSWRGGFSTAALGLDASWLSTFNPEAVDFQPTLCICDDTNKESADFILADDVARRVVLVHAKASATFRKYSASAVQEVCAQAQKNTALFSTYSLQRPGNYRLWDKPHKFRGDHKTNLVVNRRVRLPISGTAADAWSTLSELLHNPLTNREIWLVLGNMLSAETFHTALKKRRPEPETLQLNHLLQTTIAAASSVGAKTRIFCAP